jgi:hypothetical protein
MSNRIVEAAKAALTAPGFETAPGYCTRWVRQVVQSVTRDFDAVWGADANITGELLRLAGYAVAVTSQKQPGDILVKFYPPHGHIGIYVGDGIVAENSPAHYDRHAHPDARGTRTLARWGNTNLIARLPVEPVEPPLWRVLINDVVIGRAIIRDHRAFVPVRRFEEALGCEIGYDEVAKQVLIQGKPLPGELVIHEGSGYAWARDLAKFHGLLLDTPEPQTIRYRRR